MDHAGAAGRIRTRSGDLADHPAVVITSERMDEDPGWRELPAGRLLHVAPDLTTKCRTILDRARGTCSP